MDKYTNPFPEVPINEDSFYFLCSAGMMETVIVCNCYEELKKKYASSIYLLISSAHEFVVRMYCITNYYIVDQDGTTIEKLDQIALSSKCKKPLKGKVFVANPYAHVEMRNQCKDIIYGLCNVSYWKWFISFLNLKDDLKPRIPQLKIEKLSDKLSQKCSFLGDIDDVALIIPETFFLPEIDISFWDNLITVLKKQNKVPLCFCINPINRIKETEYIDLSMEEVYEIANLCSGIYSARNGFCDAFFAFESKLHVFYPSYKVQHIFGVTNNYRVNSFERTVMEDINIWLCGEGHNGRDLYSSTNFI